MNKDSYKKQLKGIIDEYNTFKKSDLGDIELESRTELLIRSKTAALRIAGRNSHYYLDIETATNSEVLSSFKLKNVIGIISALMHDLENDYLITMSEMIHSELFTDYIEMAAYLINEGGYKDAAAVITGSTLESHLRLLCTKNSISVQQLNQNQKISYKKAETMNTDLAKANVYNLSIQKQVTAWLELRNNAAHAKYDEYTTDQIKLMNEGIRNFIISNPA